MSRSKQISDETIKSIFLWVFSGLIAFLFFANSVGFAMAFGFVFIIVPLFFPFVFLIIGLSKDPKPSSINNKYKRSGGTGGGGGCFLEDEYMFGSGNSSFSDSSIDFGSDSDDDTWSSIDSIKTEDYISDPLYSYMDCNIYHTDIPTISSDD